MSKQQLKSVPQIAQTLVDHLPEDMDNELRNLIAAAKRDEDVTVEIIDLFAKHEATRGWMEEQLTGIAKRNERSGPSSGYSGLAGNSPVPLSQRWVCPDMPEAHWVMVIQEGEKPPLCKVHNARMIRGNLLKG